MLATAADRAPAGSPLRQVLNGHLADCWILAAKVARKSDQYSKAYNLLLEAEKSFHSELFLERAKLSWARDRPDKAILRLSKGVKDRFPWWTKEFSKTSSVSVSDDQIQLCFRAKLLLARYLGDASNSKAEAVHAAFNEAKKLFSQNEEVFYYSASYYDKYIGKNYKDSDLDMHGDIISHIITLYGRSLAAGCRNIHQSLPRMLSLWLDYGARVAVASSKQKPDMKRALTKMTEHLKKCCKTWPTYYFLVVFPLLSSRICHPHEEIWVVLKTILVDTFVHFPNQVFWQLVAILKSSYKTRSKRCEEVFRLACTIKSELGAFVADGKRLADALQTLADITVAPGDSSLENIMPGLSKLLSKTSFSKIMIPTTKNMSLMLPSEEAGSAGVDMLRQHDPFPATPAHFYKVEDAVTVMRSIVAPKKVTFVGSDGNKYSFLCKPKDDLRRDCRLGDFNDLLNKLFR